LIVFKVHLPNDTKSLGVGHSANGLLNTILPQGAIYSSYELNMYVQIFDNDYGNSYFYFDYPIKVRPNTSFIDKLMMDVKNNIPINVNDLYGATSQEAVQQLLSYSSILNTKSSEASLKAGIENTPIFGEDLFAQFFAISNNLGKLTATEMEVERNQRADIRDQLIEFVNNISISDLNSVKAQSSLLSELTRTTSELTRYSAEKCTDQTIRLIEALDMYADSSIEDLEIAARSIAETLGNMAASLSGSLNGRYKYLSKDFLAAITKPDDYDVDIELFWSNPNNFPGKTLKEIQEMQNQQRQQFQVIFKLLLNYFINILFDFD
jgi:hypothetical protein